MNVGNILHENIVKLIQTYYVCHEELQFKFKRKIQTRTGIWRSEVQSPVKFWMFLLNLNSNSSGGGGGSDSGIGSGSSSSSSLKSY